MKKSLYDEIADRWYCGGTIKFYSDPHFGDMESYAFRFPNKYSEITDDIVKELDIWQIKNINSTLGKNDTIVFLGDIGDIECIKKIRGYKVLVLGNHDHGATYYKKSVTTTFSTADLSSEDKALYKRAGMMMFDVDKVTARAGYAIARELQDKYSKVTSNGLFDEVYEGALMISDKIILSHEPVDFEYAFNIHGHVHGGKIGYNAPNHFNCCAEHIGYKPVAFKSLIESGLFRDVPNIHRITIDNATERKQKKG